MTQWFFVLGFCYASKQDYNNRSEIFRVGTLTQTKNHKNLKLSRLKKH